jgi:hypothetical protein
MKKVMLLTIFAALMMISSAAVAQTATGTLTVTATVNGSIQLVFNSDAAGLLFLPAQAPTMPRWRSVTFPLSARLLPAWFAPLPPTALPLAPPLTFW